MDNHSKLISETYLLARESDANVAIGGEFHGLKRDIENESDPHHGRLADMLWLAYKQFVKWDKDMDFNVVPNMLGTTKMITCPVKRKKLMQLHMLMDEISYDDVGPRPLKASDWDAIAEKMESNGTPMVTYKKGDWEKLGQEFTRDDFDKFRQRGDEQRATQAGEEAEKRRPPSRPSFDEPSFGTDY